MTMILQTESHWTRRMEMVVPYRRRGLVYQVLDGEALLYDPDNQSTHRLNETASSVWQGCDGRSTTVQLAERLTRRYDVPLDTALEDVEQLIATFAHAGLVTAEGD